MSRSPDGFEIRRSIASLAHQFSMPRVSSSAAYRSKLEQMQHWLKDPILCKEAEAWAARNGYELEFNEYGYPIEINTPTGDFDDSR